MALYHPSRYRHCRAVEGGASSQQVEDNLTKIQGGNMVMTNARASPLKNLMAKKSTVEEMAAARSPARSLSK